MKPVACISPCGKQIFSHWLTAKKLGFNKTLVPLACKLYDAMVWCNLYPYHCSTSSKFSKSFGAIYFSIFFVRQDKRKLKSYNMKILAVCLTEDIKKLMNVVAALAPKNCDDIFNLRQQAVVDGVYDIHVGGSIVQTYCEFNQNGTNWMVRKQIINHLRYLKGL